MSTKEQIKHDAEQKAVALINITHYESFEEFEKYNNVDREEFQDRVNEGWYQVLTCGTYNGATDTFTPWAMDDNHYLTAIRQYINEADEWDTLAEIYGDELQSDADYIRAMTEYQTIFTLEGGIYCDRD